MSTGNALGKAGMGLAWHQGMKEPGRRRGSGQGTLLVPDSQRLSLAEELELHWIVDPPRVGGVEAHGRRPAGCHFGFP